MLRLVFIVLLSALALKQVSSCLGLAPVFEMAELCSSTDEGEDEKGSKPDVKGHIEDKLHITNWGMYGISTTLKIIMPFTSDQPYTRFVDQPNTPPPDFR